MRTQVIPDQVGSVEEISLHKYTSNVQLIFTKVRTGVGCLSLLSIESEVYLVVRPSVVY